MYLDDIFILASKLKPAAQCTNVATATTRELGQITRDFTSGTGIY